MDFKLELSKLLKEVINLDENEIYNLIEVPNNKEMGDYAFPCFRLAKEFRKAPPIIANELIEQIPEANFIKSKETKGAYINFFIDESVLAKNTLEVLFKNPDDFGKQDIGHGKKIVIDYSAPNIAKPFHVGHLRSTVIGNALYNIYNTLGYSSYGINYLGDWGTQFGKLIVAFKKWGNEDEIKENGIDALNKIYVKFHEEAEKDEALNDEARANLVKMQNGDEETLALWSWFKDISLEEFNRIYKKLGMSFDSYRGESYYNDKMMPVVEEIREKGLLQTSNGAQIVDLEEYKMPPCLILRSDGGTLYPTRDIAAAIDRKKEFDFEKAIYITAVDQNLHFAQWFKVIELMGFDWAKDLVHVGFGLVTLDSGKLSTRKGHVVLMEDLLNESIEKTGNIIENNNPNLENKDEVAAAVGIGAIIFNDLYNSRIKDVVFSWDRILNFDGETGPYVQYTHARCNSIIEKVGNIDFDKIDYDVLSDPTSKEVVKLIYTYPDKIVDAANKNEPYFISRHLVELSQAFNKFYNNNKVMVDDENVKNSRASLVFAVRAVLRNGLSILGIQAPNNM